MKIDEARMYGCVGMRVESVSVDRGSEVRGQEWLRWLSGGVVRIRVNRFEGRIERQSRRSGFRSGPEPVRARAWAAIQFERWRRRRDETGRDLVRHGWHRRRSWQRGENFGGRHGHRVERRRRLIPYVFGLETLGRPLRGVVVRFGGELAWDDGRRVRSFGLLRRRLEAHERRRLQVRQGKRRERVPVNTDRTDALRVGPCRAGRRNTGKARRQAILVQRVAQIGG